jgi:DNA-binding MarR family transcriptional regulator
MSYQLLEELLPYLKAFEEREEEPNLDAFIDWIRGQRQSKPEKGDSPLLNAEIARHIGELYKHAKSYIKKAFEGSIFSSPEDFAYLAVLSHMGSLRKTELIQENVGEISAGMEVIKRLQRHGLVRDFPDPEDGRSRRVEITAKGKTHFQEILKPMYVAGDIIAGDLSLEERQQLLLSLKKLSKLHRKIYQEASGQELEAIREEVNKRVV